MNPYDDVIFLRHPEPKTQPRMAIEARAAQFAPFAALIGYDEAVNEAARYTEEMPELTEEEAARIDCTLQRLQSGIDQGTQTRITYFLPDTKKNGGTILTVHGIVQKIDGFLQRLTVDGTEIPFARILGIEPIETEQTGWKDTEGDRNE